MRDHGTVPGPGPGHGHRARPMLHEQVAAAVRERAHGRDLAVGRPGPHVVGVVGAPGVDAAAFALALAVALEAPVVPADAFAAPGRDPHAQGRALVDRVLRPVLAGRPARWRRHDPVTGVVGPVATTVVGRFLVVEGAAVGAEPVRGLLTYLVRVGRGRRAPASADLVVPAGVHAPARSVWWSRTAG